MSKLRIIARLWSHITDLQLYISGNRKKSLEQMGEELDVTEMFCRPYVDTDDLNGTEGLWKEISKEDAKAIISKTKTPDQVIINGL